MTEAGLIIGAGVVGVLLLISLVRPMWGCGGFVGVVAMVGLFATDNGMVAIGGAVLVLVVFFITRMKGGDVSITISGDNYGSVDVHK